VRDLEVRGAVVPADADALWTILEPVIREGTTYPVDPSASREDIFAYWFAPDKKVFVAEREGAIVGTYYIRPNSTGPADHVANAGFMVHPDARRQGIAQAMALDCLARAKALGFIAMQFNLVIAANTGALALWLSLGMKEVGRLAQAFRHPHLGLVDAIVMYRLL